MFIYCNHFSGAHPASCTMGTGGVLSPGVKLGRGVMLTTHPHLMPSRECVGAIPPLPPSASMACRGTAFFLYLCLSEAYSGDEPPLLKSAIALCFESVSTRFMFSCPEYASCFSNVRFNIVVQSASFPYARHLSLRLYEPNFVRALYVFTRVACLCFLHVLSILQCIDITNQSAQSERFACIPFCIGPTHRNSLSLLLFSIVKIGLQQFS
jgi:hypothetical protein